MKVRVIRKPNFTSLHHVQIKRWWWPFWVTVSYDDVDRCRQVAQNLLTHGEASDIVYTGESK